MALGYSIRGRGSSYVTHLGCRVLINLRSSVQYFVSGRGRGETVRDEVRTIVEVQTRLTFSEICLGSWGCAVATVIRGPLRAFRADYTEVIKTPTLIFYTALVPGGNL